MLFTDEINYEHLFNGTVSEKLKIAKLIKENLKILEDLKKWWIYEEWMNRMGPGDWVFFHVAVHYLQNWKYIIIIIMGGWIK